MEFQWNKPVGQIIKEAAGGEEGLLFLASQAERLMDPYVPADNLALAQNVDIYAEGGHGVIHYLSPYAHYQYEGTLYVDPITKKGAFRNEEGRYWSRPGVAKVKTDKKLKHSKFRHPLATSYWDKAMMTARKADLAQAYENYLKGKG